MIAIDKIIRVESALSKDSVPYYRTYAICGGDEVVGFGNDYKVGEKVEVFFDPKWDVAKMQHHLTT